MRLRKKAIRVGMAKGSLYGGQQAGIRGYLEAPLPYGLHQRGSRSRVG